MDAFKKKNNIISREKVKLIWKYYYVKIIK